MHGVRRGARPSPHILEQERERSNFLSDLIRRALVVRNTPLHPPFEQSFEQTYSTVRRALEANPDEYTLWAFRREVLIARCRTDQAVQELWREEINLTTRALQRHPKAYPAWQHRLWLLERGHTLLGVDNDAVNEALREEQRLSAFMLSKDGRNFHGWAHRMRVKAIIKAQSPDQTLTLDREELAFVESKINEDFTNYSAWHHRSTLLPRVYTERAAEYLADELQFVRQAFYTEPDVQSAWFYHRWLLAGAPAQGSRAVVRPEILKDELAACEELLTIEPEARYALQTKACILINLGRSMEAEKALDSLEKIVSIVPSAWFIIERSRAQFEPCFVLCSIGMLTEFMLFDVFLMQGSNAERVLSLFTCEGTVNSLTLHWLANASQRHLLNSYSHVLSLTAATIVLTPSGSILRLFDALSTARLLPGLSVGRSANLCRRFAIIPSAPFSVSSTVYTITTLHPTARHK